MSETLNGPIKNEYDLLLRPRLARDGTSDSRRHILMLYLAGDNGKTSYQWIEDATSRQLPSEELTLRRYEISGKLLTGHAVKCEVIFDDAHQSQRVIFEAQTEEPLS